tara:strand:+ start:13700 stop:14983 length:1284 start_codon:yes stop_codon:yes gene_type:complete
MSKHYKQLKKLSKSSLGLNTTQISSEIDDLKSSREDLISDLYETSETVIAAEVLSDMVTNYHLKNVDKTGEVYSELSGKCESVEVIIKNKTKVDGFFSSSKSKELSEILSTTTLYGEFLYYGVSYADDSLTLYIEKLLESGELQLVFGGRDLSEESLIKLNEIVLNYLPTYKQKFTEYLPEHMDYVDSFENVENLYLEDGKGDGIISKTKGLLSVVRNIYNRTKIIQLEIVTQLESNIREYKLSFVDLDISDKNIISTYGEPNLKNEKDRLNYLQNENESIDDTISTLVRERERIIIAKKEKDDSFAEVGNLLGDNDTSFIVDNDLINLPTAAETHKKTLTLFSGERIGEIINAASDEGKFFVEVFELTDIEAAIVLGKGYELLESSEDLVYNYNTVEGVRKTENLTTWTISWENGNSFTGGGKIVK